MRQAAGAKLRTTDFTVHTTYDRDPILVFGSYSRREVSNEVVNDIVTEPGFLGGLMFEVAALYESDIDRGSGGVRVSVTDAVTVGTELGAYRNRGTFGLNWEQYQVFGELLSPAGYLVRLSYQYNSLNEEEFDFDDYNAHMMTVSVGYRF